MRLTASGVTRRLKSRLNGQRGLIGVDVGTRVIKLAQVERYRSTWRLADIRVVPLAHNRKLSGLAIEEGLIGESLEGLKNGPSRFAGRHAACLLPTDISEPEAQMLPQASECEFRSMVQTDGQGSDADSVVDVWSDRQAWDESTPLVRVSSLSVPEGAARQCAEDLLSHGLHCEFLDGLPFAMSRAVRLVDPDAELQTVAALDWGHSKPLLTVLRNGVPAFTRVLRTCGTEHIESAVEAALDATPYQTARLLSLTPIGAPESESRLSGVLNRLLSPQLERAISQIRRTLTFLGQEYPELVPARLWLLGGGATITGIDTYIAERLELETNVWQLPQWQLAPSLRQLKQQPLFASAVGLSVRG